PFFLFLMTIPILEAKPYSLEVLFDGVPVEGGGWVLTLTLLAKTDLESAEIRIETSEGLIINAGADSWQGPLASDEEEVLEVSLTIIAPLPQEVIVRVRGKTQTGNPFEERVFRKIPID
ncbi:MAG: hypothetical protein ACE5FY_04135, partial [Nitrospiria bacterium]